MSRVKIFPNQNVQERFLTTKSSVMTSKCLVFIKLLNISLTSQRFLSKISNKIHVKFENTKNPESYQLAFSTACLWYTKRFCNTKFKLPSNINLYYT